MLKVWQSQTCKEMESDTWTKKATSYFFCVNMKDQIRSTLLLHPSIFFQHKLWSGNPLCNHWCGLKWVREGVMSAIFECKGALYIEVP